MNTNPLSSHSFDMPLYLAPSSWVEHIPFAFDLVNKIRPKLIVELGVYNGASYFAFCQAVRAANLTAACYGIDSWQGDEHTSFYNEEIFEKVNSYNKATYADFSTLLRSDFSESLHHFRDNSIDLLHIDGLHTYEAVKNDFETWLPKLSDSSIVLFHDSAVRDRGFGVFKLWEELSSVYPSFSFEHGYGLGVLATGKKIPEELVALFQYGDKEIAQTRALYHRLGLSFSEMLKVEELKRSVDELEGVRTRVVQLQQEVETLGAWGRSSNEELDDARQKYTDLHDRYEKISSQFEQKTRESEKHNDALQRSYKSNYQLKKELKDKSELVIKLEAAKNELESNRIYKLEAEKKELESRLTDIYSSDGYRLLSIYYRAKDKLIPENSGRQKKLKKVKQFLKSNKVFSKLRGKKPPSVTVSASQLARDYNVIPEVPANIHFPLALPVFEEPLVSIIIPAYNNWAFTRNCIISIYQFTEDIPYEIIVGDNVSTDETVHFEKYFTNVNYLRNKENYGYIRNINNAASHARGRYILTLNNDTTVTKNWLSSMLDVMNKDEKVGLVGSKLVFPDGSLQEAGGIIWQDASGWNYGREGNPDAPEYNYLKEVDYISGASNLVRKELWDQLKGLDERYVPAYFDDSDLAFNIRQLGYKTVYQPLSVVIHYEGLTHGTNTGSGTKKYQAINTEKFIQKWKPTLLKDQFPNAESVFYARDRSRYKKTIVVIDHYVPHFDKDAGSRTTFQLIQLFIRHNYNVKFIGDNFYKHEPYTTILQQMGVEVLYGGYYKDNWQDWIRQNKKYIDFFYINRPHISIKYIDFLKENTRAKIVYYGHDLHFVRELLQYEIEKDPELLRSAEEWKGIETDLIRKSDTILTLSCTEKEIIEKETGHKDVQLMPAFYYSHFNEPVTDFGQRQDLLFVGGFDHKPNVDAVIWFTKEVFPLISRQLKDVRFIIAGSKPPKEVTRLASDKVEVKGYIPDNELNDLYRRIKMVVIPLRYGAGVKGKTVETMYHGVPFVTTSFGIEGLKDIQAVTDSQNGAEEFANRLLALYPDSDALQEFSRKEIAYAKKYFSREVATDVILKTFS